MKIQGIIPRAIGAVAVAGFRAVAYAGLRAATWTQTTFGGGAGYDANNANRNILKPVGSRTAAELSLTELPALRAYARQLERNNPTARAACDATAALVVGSGIALEPDQPEWSELQTEKVRKEWLSLCDTATVDGRSIYELQAQGWRDVFTAGELVWRLVMDRDRVAKGQIGLCILPLESEWLDGYSGAVMQVFPDRSAKVGPVTVDAFGRPMRYEIKNPENVASFPIEDVPASQIIHVFERRRSMQTRGESWLAPVIETLNQERDLVTIELQAAKTGASIGLAITSDAHADLDTTEDGDTADPAQSLRIGGVARLFPGDKLEPFQTNRPSQQIMPFRAGLRGDSAAALRVPQRFLDRDISRVGSYSAMRGDNQDEERLIGPGREWYGHATIGRFYKETLPFICAKVGVPLPRQIKYKLLPDGQPYVDPETDIAAAQSAINNGLSTKENEVGKRGGDWRAIARQRDVELAREAASAVERIKAIQAACDASGVPGLTWAHVMTLGGASSAPGAYLAASITPPPAEVVADEPQPEAAQIASEDGDRAESRAQQRAESLAHVGALSRLAQIATAPPAQINVAPPSVSFRSEPVQVIVPAAAPPVTHVRAEAAPAPAPVVNVTVPAPVVTVENTVQVPQRVIRAAPQSDGTVLMTPLDTVPTQEARP